MIVNEVGTYITNQEYKGGNACSIWTIPKGTVIDVTQIDNTGNQFMSKAFGDWTYWEKNLTKIEQ